MIPVDRTVLPGQRVDISVAAGAPLTAALLSYGAALVAMFGCIGLAVVAGGNSDAVVAAGAVTGLALALAWLRARRSCGVVSPVVRILPASSPDSGQ